MSPTTTGAMASGSDAAKTPGQIAREAFYDGESYLAWHQLADGSHERWERVAATCAALAAPAPVVPEEVRRLLERASRAIGVFSMDGGVHADVLEEIETLLAATPSKPVGDGGEAANRFADQIWAAIGALETPERASGVEDAEASAQVLGHAVDTAKSILRAALRNAESIETASTPPAGGGAVDALERLAEKFNASRKHALENAERAKPRDDLYDYYCGQLGQASAYFHAVRAVQAALAAAPAAPEPAAAEALRGISDDFMTSDRHHPGYVLIPAAKFEQLRAAEASLSAPSQAETAGGDFQARVQAFMRAVAGDDATDVPERRDRFAEEAMELAQALGADREAMHQLVDYVFGRPVGEPAAEMGGTAVTLAGLAAWAGLDMAACGEAELARCNTPAMIAKIRSKRSNRHGRGALPGALPEPTPANAGAEGGQA